MNRQSSIWETIHCFALFIMDFRRCIWTALEIRAGLWTSQGSTPSWWLPYFELISLLTEKKLDKITSGLIYHGSVGISWRFRCTWEKKYHIKVLVTCMGLKPEFWTQGPNSWASRSQVQPLSLIWQINRYGDRQRKETDYMRWGKVST
jgi:hypothetical protein